jgi:hypothetical protein
MHIESTSLRDKLKIDDPNWLSYFLCFERNFWKLKIREINFHNSINTELRKYYTATLTYWVFLGYRMFQFSEIDFLKDKVCVVIFM